jgi:hypothetical protein
MSETRRVFSRDTETLDAHTHLEQEDIREALCYGGEGVCAVHNGRPEREIW